MAKKKNSKASTSPRNTASTTSAGTANTPTSISNATTTTTTQNSEHDTIKVTINEELIRHDVDAMMGSPSPSPTATIHTTTVEGIPIPISSASSSTSSTPKWIGSIDQGTSSTRFMIFSSSEVIGMVQMEHQQIYTHPGWHEHDPIEIWKNILSCISTLVKSIQSILTKQQSDFLFHSDTATRTNDGNDATNHFLSAIGITNQRETIVCWNRKTGRPYYNAIVWDDARTTSIVNEILSYHTISKEQVQYITTTTGLPISTYFSTMKMKWLINNVEQIRYDLQYSNENVCFGTIDTWIVYQLTGSIPKSESTGRPLKGNAGCCNIGGIYVTDVTNASRWDCMNLQSCQWDTKCIDLIFHDTPYKEYINIKNNFPTIYPSSYLYGYINIHCGLPNIIYGGNSHSGKGSSSTDCNSNIPIAAILGDQQAALFGQAAYTKGCAKNTYGTGLFLMINTGPNIVPKPSTHGLLTTVAYQIGIEGDVYYAYEGSVSHSGSTIQWLRDQLGIISTVSESEALAKTTTSNDGLYMVPAFSGLLAPHWKNHARGCIVGMTALHHKGHICRAALEATAYQTKDVFDAIIKDTDGITLSTLNVDGGGTYNALLMQFQADILNVPVVRPKIMETTSIGVAYAAGLTMGIYTSTTELSKLWTTDIVYTPQMDNVTRNTYIKGWKKALTKSFHWIDSDSDSQETDDTPNIDSSATTDTSGDNVNIGNNLESSWTVISPPTTTTTATIAPAEEVVKFYGTSTTDAVLDKVASEETSTIVEDSEMERNIPPSVNEVEADAVINATSEATEEEEIEENKVVTTDVPPSIVPSNLSNNNSGKDYNLFTVATTAAVAFTAGIIVTATTRKR